MKACLGRLGGIEENVKNDMCAYNDAAQEELWKTKDTVSYGAKLTCHRNIPKINKAQLRKKFTQGCLFPETVIHDGICPTMFTGGC